MNEENIMDKIIQQDSINTSMYNENAKGKEFNVFHFCILNEAIIYSKYIRMYELKWKINSNHYKTIWCIHKFYL